MFELEKLQPWQKTKRRKKSHYFIHFFYTVVKADNLTMLVKW